MKLRQCTPLLMLALCANASGKPNYDVAGVSIGMDASRIRIALGWRKPGRFSDIPDNGVTTCAGGNVYHIGMKNGVVVEIQGEILRKNGINIASTGANRREVRKRLGDPAFSKKNIDNYELGDQALSVRYVPSQGTVQSFVLTKVGF